MFFDRIIDQNVAEFHPFSITHFIALAVSILLFVVFLRYSKTLKNKPYEVYIRFSLGVLMILLNITLYTHAYSMGYPWYAYLPEATCGFAMYSGAFTLFTKNRFLYVLTFFWGFGALLSFLGPTILEGPDKYNFYQYFLRHFMIIFVPFYMMNVFDYKIYRKDYRTFFVVTLSMTILGTILGLVINDPDLFNPFFTMKPKIQGTPFTPIREYSHFLYWIVWVSIASLLGYVWGMPHYEENKKRN